MYFKNNHSNTRVLYLSLGSNIENRLEHINVAIKTLEKDLGKVINKACLYETPSWGFEGNSFLNTCIAIETEYNTKECLQLIKTIETKIGRKQKTKTEYENRPIDIDILYSSEGIYNYYDLVIPHALLHERKFVLYPLRDICPLYKHPLIHKNTMELIEVCKDDSEIVLLTER